MGVGSSNDSICKLQQKQQKSKFSVHSVQACIPNKIVNLFCLYFDFSCPVVLEKKNSSDFFQIKCKVKDRGGGGGSR